jgi:CRP-like cAMP-binding protein
MKRICVVICERIRGTVADVAAAAGARRDLLDVLGVEACTREVPRLEPPALPRLSVDPAQLRSLTFFESLEPEELAELMQLGTLREVPRGAVIWREGDPSRGALVVLRGALRLSVERGGWSETCFVQGPGRLVGGVAIADGGIHPVDCTVRESAWIFEIEVDALRRLWAQATPLSHKVFDATVESLVEVQRLLTLNVARLAAQGRTADSAQTSTSTNCTRP